MAILAFGDGTDSFSAGLLFDSFGEFKCDGEKREFDFRRHFRDNHFEFDVEFRSMLCTTASRKFSAILERFIALNRYETTRKKSLKSFVSPRVVSRLKILVVRARRRYDSPRRSFRRRRWRPIQQNPFCLLRHLCLRDARQSESKRPDFFAAATTLLATISQRTMPPKCLSNGRFRPPIEFKRLFDLFRDARRRRHRESSPVRRPPIDDVYRRHQQTALLTMLRRCCCRA